MGLENFNSKDDIQEIELDFCKNPHFEQAFYTSAILKIKMLF
jgi:hypothetical protein